ncbi:hypothetical protein L1987_84581 [Smallanthus sonchifolius]|uniref:Uncharacterized protein n=1 Tax=Smallanthus sonchifolius TaxID=185202 RepID=A0ACB8XUC4_9ASTR|nr:hypothetical protein L1987_84581 [Smallanthus sonchifolius]
MGIWSDDRFLNRVCGKLGWHVILSIRRGGFYLALSRLKGDRDGTPCTLTTSFLREVRIGVGCPKYRMGRGQCFGLCIRGDLHYMGGGLDLALLLRLGWGRGGTNGTLGTYLKRDGKVRYTWMGKRWTHKTRVSRKGTSCTTLFTWHDLGAKDPPTSLKGIKEKETGGCKGQSRANPNGLKSNPRSASSSGDLGNQVAGPSCSKVEGSGFNFSRVVQGAKVKPVKPPIQHPFTNSLSAGPGLSRLQIKVILKKRSYFVKSRARLLPTSILSSPSPGGLHTTNGGKTYGISESQRKAIADRISVSSSICIEETVNWCPREWDYFNDLCMSLGLDPDYCIEDVESDAENGTAQFISDQLKAGSPKANRK